MKLRLCIKRNMLLLFACLYVGSAVCAQDKNKDSVVSYEILEKNEYCWDGKHIKNRSESNSKKLEFSKSLHDNIIIPFFIDFAKLMRDTIYEVSHLKEIEYGNQYYYIKTCGKSKEECQRYSIDINILSDIKTHSQMRIDLDKIKSQDFVYVDVVSEAPIQGLVFWYFDELVLIHYNVFYDTKQVIGVTKQFIKSLNRQDG